MFEQPPEHAHILQFYGEPAHQVEAAATFVEAGFKQNEKVLLGDTKERLESILRELKNRGVKPDSYVNSGQLTILESEEILPGLARFDQLNERGIQEMLDLTRKQVDSGTYSRVRFCMRFAPQVSESGKPDLAASMEDAWQTSSRRHPSIALCAYSMKNLTPEMDSMDYWKQLMKSHTHILADVGLIVPLSAQEFSIPYMEYQTGRKPTVQVEQYETQT